MRKFSEYLTEQDELNPTTMPGERRWSGKSPEQPGEEAEEPDEFDVRNMPRNPGEKETNQQAFKVCELAYTASCAPEYWHQEGHHACYNIWHG